MFRKNKAKATENQEIVLTGISAGQLLFLSGMLFITLFSTYVRSERGYYAGVSLEDCLNDYDAPGECGPVY